MGDVLSQTQTEQYHEQGFVSPIDLFSEQVAAGYVERLQLAEAKYSDQLNGENRNNAHLAFTFLDELAHHPVVLDAVEDLIGSDFSLWGSVLFIKEPHSSHFVSWHQDATYRGITPHTVVTPGRARRSSAAGAPGRKRSESTPLWITCNRSAETPKRVAISSRAIVDPH